METLRVCPIGVNDEFSELPSVRLSIILKTADVAQIRFRRTTQVDVGKP